MCFASKNLVLLQILRVGVLASVLVVLFNAGKNVCGYWYLKSAVHPYFLWLHNESNGGAVIFDWCQE